jgi:hypothetical protein
MSSVIGVPSSKGVVSTTRPYRKCADDHCTTSYTTSWDVTKRLRAPELDKHPVALERSGTEQDDEVIRIFQVAMDRSIDGVP